MIISEKIYDFHKLTGKLCFQVEVESDFIEIRLRAKIKVANFTWLMSPAY